MALSGFRYNGHSKLLRLVPALYEDNFNTFCCVDGSWGNITQKKGEGKKLTINIKSGVLKIRKLNLEVDAKPKLAKVKMNGKLLDAKIAKAENEFWDANKMVAVTL